MSIGELIGLIAVAALIGAAGWYWMERAAGKNLPDDDDTPDQNTRGGGGPGGVRL